MKIKHIILNNIYALSLIKKACPFKIFWDIFCSLVSSFMAVANIYVLRYVLNGAQRGIEFEKLWVPMAVVGITQTVYYVLLEILCVKIEPYISLKMNDTLQKMAFEKTLECELSCYEDSEFYNTYTKAMANCRAHVESALSNVCSFIYFLSTLITSGILTMIIDPFLLVFSVIPFFISLIIKKKSKMEFEIRQECAPQLRKEQYAVRVFYQNRYAKEFRLTKMPIVLLKDFKQAVNKIILIYKTKGVSLFLLSFVIDVISELVSTYLILLYMAWQTLVTHKMMYGDCLVLVTAVSTIYVNFQSLINNIMSFYTSALNIENIRNFMSFQKENEGGSGELLPSSGDISLRNVSFCYKGASQNALSNINMEIPEGKFIAIAGHNGAGKTTLVKLLLNLYRPSEGLITLNGKDINQYNVACYRGKFSVLLQDYKHFSATVKDNVLMDEDADSISFDVVENALKFAGLWKRIQDTPDGINTVLDKEFDDAGLILSGGEAQKLAMAHVYAHNSPFIIFDEPSAALDPLAEHQMFEKIKKIYRHKTIILISHRLSSLTDVDYIYYMDKGKIVEQGSHRELIELNGRYAELFYKQAEAYLSEVQTDEA